MGQGGEMFLKLIPKNLLSYIVGWLVHRRWPHPMNTWMVAWFARRYRINMDEAELPISDYPSIGALFTRRLKPGLRPVSSAEIVHPADSQLTESGPIHDGVLYQLKGWPYRLQDLLQSETESFEGGQFVTYYLCPTDYHRVHSPVDGEIVACHHIPGYLWPVNAWSVSHIARLFAINERVVIWIKTPKGLVAVVMVGATNVGKMTMSFDSGIVTNLFFVKTAQRKSYNPSISVQRGQELGVFNMGSTVVVIYPPSILKGHVLTPQYVKVGEAFLGPVII